jgi:hypothetical protein
LVTRKVPGLVMKVKGKGCNMCYTTTPFCAEKVKTMIGFTSIEKQLVRIEKIPFVAR